MGRFRARNFHQISRRIRIFSRRVELSLAHVAAFSVARRNGVEMREIKENKTRREHMTARIDSGKLVTTGPIKHRARFNRPAPATNVFSSSPSCPGRGITRRSAAPSRRFPRSEYSAVERRFLSILVAVVGNRRLK